MKVVIHVVTELRQFKFIYGLLTHFDTICPLGWAEDFEILPDFDFVAARESSMFHEHMSSSFIHYKFKIFCIIEFLIH